MKNIPGLLWSACFLLAALSLLGSQSDAQVAVRYPEGSLHGFLVLRSMDGQTLAHGDITQVAQGDRITSHMVFHFNDGSIHDETAVFSQRRNFHLLTDHLVQKGPSFPHPQDVLINTADGQVVVHYTG